MGKTLRVCLAMGGGVSLGSFSGSALTEGLKLLILYGKDSNKEPYDNVIVDGMSGASAGAIALTIMLKCLIDYKSMMPLYNSNLTDEDLINEIANDYFDQNPDQARTHKNIGALKALQLAQKIQYKIWVNEVDSTKLYGKKIKDNYNPNPTESFALLDRKLLEDLTKKYLMSSEGTDISRRELLDPKRVIFACSLTNLLPIEIDASYENINKLDKNVLKSIGSENHSELRVIDFVFDQNNTVETDDRWIRFCSNPDQENPTHFNITDKAAWATISSSALACGAFPIAFEPVVLKRYQKEFGDSGWPKSFREIQEEIDLYKTKNNNIFKENSFFGEDGNNKLDYQSFNFPYIDGGTFNNEPIREAFKIGTFQDFGRTTNNEERLVLFVDPIVRQEQHHSFKVSSFSPVKVSGDEINFKKELSKLFGNVSNIVGVLANQGSIKEEHKMIDIKENFALRKTIFDYLNVNKDINRNLNIGIISTAFNKVTKNLKGNILSLGTRDPITYFLEEIRKSCIDQSKNNSACLHIKPQMLYNVKKGIDDGSIDHISQAYDLMKLDSKFDQNAFAQTIFKVIADFALNTDGKSEDVYRAAILPINKNLDTIELPGGEIEAFGGFASLNARKYSFEFARLSTLLSLKEFDGFRPKNPFIKDNNLTKLTNIFTSKIEEVNFFDNKGTYSKDLEKNLFKPSVDRIKGLALKNKYLSFILLKVPFIATSLFGVVAMPIFSIISLWKSVFKKSPWRGSNILKKIIAQGADTINYMTLEPVTLSIISDTKLEKKIAIRCADQKIRKRKVLEHKTKKFQGQTRYQYFMQISLLEYIKEKNGAIHPDAVSLNAESLKINAQLIQSLGLSLSNKVKIPNGIDGNLKPKKKRISIQDNYTEIIKEIRIGKYNLPLLELAINDPSASLHYSLKNINYHVNPLLEIDLQKIEDGWYFKEQTQSLSKKLLT